MLKHPKKLKINWHRIKDEELTNAASITEPALISASSKEHALSPVFSQKKQRYRKRCEVFSLRGKKRFSFFKMVWISCILVPVFLFIWHKFIQPLIDRWYGKPKLESGKTDDKLKSDEKVRFVMFTEDILAVKIALILAESRQSKSYNCAYFLFRIYTDLCANSNALIYWKSCVIEIHVATSLINFIIRG